MPVLSFEEAVAKAVSKATANLRLSADEKKLFEKAVAEDPELKEGYLRQDDYSRKLNEFKKVETEFETVKARNATLESWAEENVPRWEGLVEKGIISEDGEDLMTPKQAALQKELEAARAAALAGDDMKPEELEQKVKEIVKQYGGELTKQEVDNLVANEARKIAKEEFETGWKDREKHFNENTIPYVAGFATSVAVVSSRFERETGEKWGPEKQKQMFDLMTAKKNFDAYAVEEELLAPHREKKAREAEVEARVAERLKVVRAEQGGEEFIPQAEKEKGALRMMMAREAPNDDPASLVAQAAREAAAELRAEGK